MMLWSVVLQRQRIVVIRTCDVVTITCSLFGQPLPLAVELELVAVALLMVHAVPAHAVVKPGGALVPAGAGEDVTNPL